ncbi:hypothetical protein [Streptomyces filamentosus]|uniref:hypothetical protein n=1 Tax=Streptomyces filamentosus TaxID=67294 RepID=UPI00331BDA03
MRDPWARTAAGLAAAGEWIATPDTAPPAPRTCRRPFVNDPADPGTGTAAAG